MFLFLLQTINSVHTNVDEVYNVVSLIVRLLYKTCIDSLSFQPDHYLCCLFQPTNYLDFGSSFGIPKSPEDSFTPASEPTWHKMNQANVVSNVSKNIALPLTDELDGEFETSSNAANSDSIDALTSNDAQKLANVLQQQLDAINEELAYVIYCVQFPHLHSLPISFYRSYLSTIFLLKQYK